MIWEQNCSAITMTTSLQEKGRVRKKTEETLLSCVMLSSAIHTQVKCAQYWPERRDDDEYGQVQNVYGDLEVRLLKRKKTRSYTVSTFSLMEMKASSELAQYCTHLVTVLYFYASTLYRLRRHVKWFTTGSQHGLIMGCLIQLVLSSTSFLRQGTLLDQLMPPTAHC